MREIIELFMLDWKRIIKSPMTLVIIIGLMLIPSLYAWFNILALWDPYGSTQSLPIGVYSADTGYEIEGTELNIGADVIDGLHENDDIAWQFTTSETQLDEAVNSGEYFAGIIIDENFSEDLINYVSNDDHDKPQINYLVNEKINAIAPKITDEGVSSIQEEVRVNFVASVTSSLTELANELGVEISDNEELAEELANLVTDAYESLDDVENLVGVVAELNLNVQALDEQIAALDNYETISGQISTFISDLAAFVDQQAEFNQQLESDYSSVANNQELLAYIDEISAFNDQLITKINEVNTEVNTQIDEVNELGTIINEQEAVPSEIVATNEQMLNDLNAINETLNVKVSELNTFKQTIDQIEGQILSQSEDLKSLYNEEYLNLTNDLADLSTTLSVNFPEIDQTIKADIDELQAIYPKLSNSLNTLDENLQDIWPQYQDSVTQVYKQVKANEDVDVQQIVDLLLVSPNRTSELLSDPIAINTTLKYHVPNYGAQSAPFYTALCLWVGAVLLTSVLSTKYHLTNKKAYTIRQMHLGRMLTFISIAIIQAIIVSVGNIYLLQAYTIDPMINILCSVFIAICFNIIVYTLASLLDNIGKAVAVVLLVLSVAGGGGNFPIQLSSEFFQTINPLLPFTHAVNVLRETVGGIYVPSFTHGSIILSIETLIVLISGTAFAPSIIKFSENLMAKTDDSHIFH